MGNIFKDFIINNELFVSEEDWTNLKENYSKEFIIQEISDAIELFEIKLPYRELTLEDVEKEYQKLLNLPPDELWCSGQWINKFEYEYCKIIEQIFIF